MSVIPPWEEDGITLEGIRNNFYERMPVTGPKLCQSCVNWLGVWGEKGCEKVKAQGICPPSYLCYGYETELTGRDLCDTCSHWLGYYGEKGCKFELVESCPPIEGCKRYVVCVKEKPVVKKEQVNLNNSVIKAIENTIRRG